MKPISKLSNKERAALLFQLCGFFIKDIIDVARQYTTEILGEKRQELIDGWDIPLLSVREWLDSSKRINDAVVKLKPGVRTTQKVFSELFHMLDSLVMLHCIVQLIQQGQSKETADEQYPFSDFINVCRMLWPEQFSETFEMIDALRYINAAEIGVNHEEFHKYFDAPQQRHLYKRFQDKGILHLFTTLDIANQETLSDLIVAHKNRKQK